MDDRKKSEGKLWVEKVQIYRLGISDQGLWHGQTT